ncbi:hypothetical protein [Desulfoluna spongiiphila]|uniref:LruC domain-containing protein n=1 Tax=Desulfoluna spongiiphila TaxID=419481 RepID=A0A1G5AXK6_9BACT|nr:hypothetical protein [Desulfoluna spongiiphila]SCX82601.1 hypothetical protein SAMN05216233_101508 [Desulfoluna spongiiphila]VVS92067.1 hypothetical protein DBB_16350 [Desulfoluna spongiiphila]
MAFSAPDFRKYIVCALFLGAFSVSQATAAPKPMKEWELGGVEARTGVNLGFENLVVERTGGSSTFVPDDEGKPDHYIEFSSMDSSKTYNGDVSIVAEKYTSPQRQWFVKDTAKVRKGEAGMVGLGIDWYYKHKRTDEYQIDKGSAFATPAEARGVTAVVVTMDNGPDPFTVEESSSILNFSAIGSYTDMEEDIGDRIQYGLLGADTGTLSMTGVKNLGQQLTIYPIGTIDGYAEGDGIALEMRSKTSIDEVTITREIGGETFTNLRATGIHMRESFSQDLHAQYKKWGNMDKDYFDGDAPSEYLDSTYDPDGFFGSDYNPDHTMLPHNLVRAPYEGGPDYYNMYDGFMLNGNINQIDFADRISGKKLVLDHGQLTDADVITGKNFDDPGDLDDDYQVHNQGMANDLDILERPITIQVKTGRTYKSFDPATGQPEDIYDDRSFIAINWPRHGSVRVEELQGFVSDPGEWPYNQFGPSLGSVILDGMRAKKTYIEIPGRKEMYAITEQNINTSDPNNWIRHYYLYEAGKLPDEQNPNGLPAWGQPDWDPVGRGQLDFLSKLGNPSNPTGGRWDMYAVKKIHGNETFDFWHIYEPPYPGSGARWVPDH